MAILKMPAEWAPQQAIWLAWPHQHDDWPGKFAAIPFVYGEIIRHLSRTQQVKLIVSGQTMQDEALQLLEQVDANLDQVRFYQVPTDRVWMRDSGPIFVRQDDDLVALDWQFNAWAKYDNWQRDDAVPGLIVRADNRKTLQPVHAGRRVVLEGGSIDVNGAGALLTTEECLLSEDIQCRNPGFDKDAYHQVFAGYLGIDDVVWLDQGIVGDDTHGHVDDIARFVATHTVVAVVEPDPGDDNHALLQENLRRLRAARVGGKSLNVVELPMPRPLYYDGVRVPASYANFLICNEVVLVPTFNDPLDRVALGVLAECFPNREIIGIHAVDLVWGFGTLHCMSQQEPA